MAIRTDLGPFAGTMAKDSLRVIGGGNSPVLEYDRAVIRAALGYLNERHEKPQCIVVGTYGPHHTYVAPPEQYRVYKKVVDIPPSYYDQCDHPAIAPLRNSALNEETLLKLRAAYFGMITALDEQIGQVRTAWPAYLERSGRKGVFVYASDHGELAGEHGLIGKSAFYEGSAKIPLLFEGAGIGRGRRLARPVSLMDLGPTLCGIAAAQAPPRQDGKSLLPQLTNGSEEEDRIVVSEVMATADGRDVPGRMLRQGKWKFVAYAFHEAYDQLFDLEADSEERNNVVRKETQTVDTFKRILRTRWDVPGILERHQEKREHYELLHKWGAAVDVPEQERWVVPEYAKILPVDD